MYLLLLVTAALSLAGQAAHACSGTTDATRWSELLEANLRHDPKAQQFVQEVAASDWPDCTDCRRLARLLLEEWDVGRGDLSLQYPRAIAAPTIDVDTVRDRLPQNLERNIVIVMVVSVTADGSVSNVETARGSGFDWLDEIARARLASTRFRPALGPDRYVNGEANLQVVVRPRL